MASHRSALSLGVVLGLLVVWLTIAFPRSGWVKLAKSGQQVLAMRVGSGWLRQPDGNLWAARHGCHHDEEGHGTDERRAPAARREIAFTADDLVELRRATAIWAAQAGLNASRVIDFLIAVNEIATNAVLYGSPAARLVLRADGNALTAEIHDRGNWQPTAAELSADGAASERGGMGLPTARRASDHMHIKTGPDGTVVTLQTMVR